jgi:hypothetical protein
MAARFHGLRVAEVSTLPAKIGDYLLTAPHVAPGLPEGMSSFVMRVVLPGWVCLLHHTIGR